MDPIDLEKLWEFLLDPQFLEFLAYLLSLILTFFGPTS